MLIYQSVNPHLIPILGVPKANTLLSWVFLGCTFERVDSADHAARRG